MSDQPTEKIERVLAALSPRELALVWEVAHAGHVAGWKKAGDRTGWSLTNDELLAEVLDRCLSRPGLYPTVSGIATEQP